MSKVKDVLGNQDKARKGPSQKLNTMAMHIYVDTPKGPVALKMDGSIDPKDRSANNEVFEKLYSTLRRMFAEPLEGDKPIMIVPGLKAIALVEPEDEVSRIEADIANKKKAKKKKGAKKKVAKKEAVKKKATKKKKK